MVTQERRKLFDWYYYIVLEFWGNAVKSRNMPSSESLNVPNSNTKGELTTSFSTTRPKRFFLKKKKIPGVKAVKKAQLVKEHQI